MTHPAAQRTRVPAKRQMMVVPILIIVLGALVTGLVSVVSLASGVVGIFAIVVSAGASILCILLYRWLDRWEPEPPHLVIAAFLWGGGVSIVLVLLLTVLTPSLAGTDFTAGVLQAPFTEELAKGLFLVLLVATRRGRGELNSLTDLLVYAGFIGTGFSFVEDMLYIASQPSLGEGVGLALFRIGFGVLGHSLYTSMVAIGIWLAIQAKSRVVEILAPIGGFAAAMVLHGIHNAAPSFGLAAYFAMQLLIMLPILIGLALLLRWSRRREQQALLSQVPRMVGHGWLSPQEAGWIVRKDWRRTMPNDPVMKRDLRSLRDSVTELAFLRDRLDRGITGTDLHRQHNELVSLITARLAPVAPYLSRGGPWQPLPARAVPPGSPLQQYGPQSLPPQLQQHPGAWQQRQGPPEPRGPGQYPGSRG